jgi:hypothetical protein
MRSWDAEQSWVETCKAAALNRQAAVARRHAVAAERLAAAQERANEIASGEYAERKKRQQEERERRRRGQREQARLIREIDALLASRGEGLSMNENDPENDLY